MSEKVSDGVTPGGRKVSKRRYSVLDLPGAQSVVKFLEEAKIMVTPGKKVSHNKATIIGK